VKHCLWTLLMSVILALVILPLAQCNKKLTAITRKSAPVSNSRCHVCHINYEEEEFAVGHAKVGVSCEKCHGQSDDHCGDEGNITPPDIMYPKAKINASCMKCHARTYLASKRAHKKLFAATDPTEYVCTDCHGEHRLTRREVQWDKTTGKLLE